MRNSHKIILIISIFIIVSCGSNKDVNEKNFADVIAKGLNKELCFSLSQREFPYVTWEYDYLEDELPFHYNKIYKHGLSELPDEDIKSAIKLVSDPKFAFASSLHQDIEVSDKAGNSRTIIKVVNYKFGEPFSDAFNNRPTDIPEDYETFDESRIHKLENILYLVSAGLIKSTDGLLFSPKLINGKESRFLFIQKHYELTDSGKIYYHQHGDNSDFCYGKVAFDKVTKWIGPKELGEYKEVEVFYKTKIVDQAEWATKKTGFRKHKLY